MLNRCALFAALAVPALVSADEGMWTFNNFPGSKVKSAYGFEPTQGWLDGVRLASARLAGGCSASVVSSNGLVMTNNHCVRSCVEALSGLQQKDFDRDGFYAKTTSEELRCPNFELNQLVEITDVTKRVQAATKDATVEKFFEAQKAVTATIEKECTTSDDLRCDVVSLYRGGRYDLYKYRRFSDLRLVFAPEGAVGHFGGDPDNFNFPRYTLDASFLRIYGTDGAPLATQNFFKWSKTPLTEGELTFVAGNPGATARQYTLSQVIFERDVALPRQLLRTAELRGVLTEYQRRGVEQKRHSNSLLLSTENRLKVTIGRQAALADAAFVATLVAAENDFQRKVNAKPALKKRYGMVWAEIAKAVRRGDQLRDEHQSLEEMAGGESLRIARVLVQYAEESGKPNAERMKEYADAKRPQLKASLLSPAPIYNELEVVRLGFALTKLRETLGADHPAVKQLLGKQSPDALANSLVAGSKVRDLHVDAKGTASGYRTELFAGGKGAIDASTDPMIVFARQLEPLARDIREKYEREYQGPLKKLGEQLARARFEVYGEGSYPDATFTPRLSYGSVKSFTAGGSVVKPLTTLGGAFERHTGAYPYALPKTWLDAKPTLALDTPFCVATNNDIIGGNSGSPLLNRKGEVVGLVFDGNIQSLGGNYGFDESVNRTVSVTATALLETLDKVYGAKRMVNELLGGQGLGGASE